MKREGFPGQRLRVVPRAILRTALQRPIACELLVTDCGFFPRAQGHGRVRPQGSGQTVVLLCTAGMGWARVGDVQHQVGPGEAVIIPRRAAHAYGADAQAPWSIWWIHVTGDAVPALTATIGATEQRPKVNVPNLSLAASLMQEIVDCLDRDETFPSLLGAAGAAWHLLTGLAAGRLVQHDPGDPVQRTIAYLAENVSESLSMDEVARHANISPSHLTALFKRATGYGPISYQTLLRMQRARNLLDTTDRSVAEIAREVGYWDPAHFSRRFAQLHETSPREYRRLTKG